MYKATKQLFDFAYQVDSLKNYILKKKFTNEEYGLIFSNENVEALILYYTFLNMMKEDAFKVELETIDDIISPYSQYNAERLKAMTSILKTDEVFTNVWAFNPMIECFNGHEITAQTLEPYTAEEIAWTCMNIMGIWGSDNFPFTGNVIRYIKACLDWESWELPPMFLSFPVILDMYPTDQLEHYIKVTKYLKDMSLKELEEVVDSPAIADKFKNTPHLLNYLIKNAYGCKHLNEKIDKTNNEILTYFKEK